GPVIRSPAFPYVAPFVVLVSLLALRALVSVPDLADQVALIAAPAVVLWWASRPVIDFRVRNAPVTLLVGVLAFVFWIGPDLLFPGYRQHWLFTNSITGRAGSALSAQAQGQGVVVALRA